MLSVFSNNGVVNSLQTFNNHVSVSSIRNPKNFLASSNESMQLLHNKFGHPTKSVLQQIMKTLPLNSVCKHSLHFCDACQYGKLHQLHFSVIDIKSKLPLEILHTDLRGPASETSMNGYRYYISFVDDFTRYSWIFSL